MAFFYPQFGTLRVNCFTLKIPITMCCSSCENFISSQAHLWGNLVSQCLSSVYLEFVHGWKRISIIYLVSVLGGSLFTTVWSNLKYCNGASGGVYGLLFSHLATLILNWKEMSQNSIEFHLWVLFHVVGSIGKTLHMELVAKVTSNVKSTVYHLN